MNNLFRLVTILITVGISQANAADCDAISKDIENSLMTIAIQD